MPIFMILYVRIMDIDKKNQTTRIIRHGDILLRQVTSIPSGAKILTSNILALGENTGHSHKLSGDFQMYEFKEKNGELKYLEILDEVKLSHQEHSTLVLPKGKYVVVNEREYNPFSDLSINEIRSVVRTRDVTVDD